MEVLRIQAAINKINNDIDAHIHITNKLIATRERLHKDQMKAMVKAMAAEHKKVKNGEL